MANLRRSTRYYERQIDKLLGIIAAQNDRIMYLAGRTWGDPPARDDRLTVSLDAMLDDSRFSYAPENYPDDDLGT